MKQFTANENALLIKEIKDYMKANIQDHINEHGYINMTTLAEDAAIAIDDDCAEEIHFEMAYEVGKELALLEEY